MAMSIGGTAIPTSISGTTTYMRQQGNYKFSPPETVRTNGRGEAVTAGYSTVVWVWEYMTLAEYNWWYTTLLGGAASVTFTSAVLANALWVETGFANCVVFRPTYETVEGDLYKNVQLKIEQIR